MITRKDFLKGTLTTSLGLFTSSIFGFKKENKIITKENWVSEFESIKKAKLVRLYFEDQEFKDLSMEKFPKEKKIIVDANWGPINSISQFFCGEEALTFNDRDGIRYYKRVPNVKEVLKMEILK